MAERIDARRHLAIAVEEQRRNEAGGARRLAAIAGGIGRERPGISERALHRGNLALGGVGPGRAIAQCVDLSSLLAAAVPDNRGVDSFGIDYCIQAAAGVIAERRA